MESDVESSLLALPAELIYNILSYLNGRDLHNVASACRLLAKHAREDSLWQTLVQDNVAVPLSSPSPCPSFRELWTSYRTYWFLTKHKLWIADIPMHGKLVVARYEPRTGSIEAYAVVAQRGAHTFGLLNWNDRIVYHTFNPTIQLDLNRPVLSISLEDAQAAGAFQCNKYATELYMSMSSGNANQPSSTIFLAKALPPHLTASNTAVWPPRRLPSPNNDRVRNDSTNGFLSSGHKPTTAAEVTEAAFRIRQWVQFGHFYPLGAHGSSSQQPGELVTTYGTLDPRCYTPTAEKPWQGIWCGDYSGHGCEFLVITQPDAPRPLPEKARKAFAAWPDSSVPRWGLHYDDDDEVLPPGGAAAATDADFDDLDDVTDGEARPHDDATKTAQPGSTHTDCAPFRGRLEAIKLTGDPNVPRGELTFVVEDLGAGGLVGYTDEPVFTDPDVLAKAQARESSSGGAAAAKPPAADAAESEQGQRQQQQQEHSGTRIVRAVGHIAGHGFTNEAYIPCQLIVISENRLAQLWIPFGHISFFERVDVDKLLRC